ncbi:MAG: cation transporter [Spirochaetales bacterium]|nr:cation transporter [Spirochaetales bacterium]
MNETAPVDKTAILDLEGAHCASCAYTIEHLGRKVEGVNSVKVDTAAHEVRVVYQGNPGSLERIAEIVRRLGYDAKVRWDSVQ